MLTIYKTCNRQFCNIQCTVPLNDIYAILTSTRLETVPETCIVEHLLAYFIFQKTTILSVRNTSFFKHHNLKIDFHQLSISLLVSEIMLIVVEIPKAFMYEYTL